MKYYISYRDKKIKNTREYYYITSSILSQALTLGKLIPLKPALILEIETFLESYIRNTMLYDSNILYFTSDFIAHKIAQYVSYLETTCVYKVEIKE